MVDNINSSTPGEGKVVQRGPGALVKGLYVGFATATCGGLISALVATLRNNPRSRLYIVGTTLNCFILGTGFYITRDIFSKRVFKCPQDGGIPPRERIILSGASAAVIGATWGAVIGGRRNLIPGFITFGIAGVGGQVVLNAIEASTKQDKLGGSSSEAPPREGILSRILNSENSPVRKLSSEEYVSKMRDKQLMVDAEIALIDEEIARLTKKLEEENARKGVESDSN
ncbi:hypothetical protein EYR41_009203 [Orbilia oligospora]|uniref:Uncharacterized protein n=1 Tax=Orbilia oligospora TaxID=2813651 RepID=A0A7C8P529_ORBOL|nr:hypothetical protein TWF751_011876 [Orbilia oligospora]TGJ65213.1 hypothetical protein EYR41_009203 [Orbilia oligospora]